MRAIMPVVITSFLVTQSKFTSESAASYDGTRSQFLSWAKEYLNICFWWKKSVLSLHVHNKNNAQHLAYSVTLS